MYVMSVLSQYSLDLTEEALEGNIDKVIGRDTEIRKMIQILSLKKKNNPVIVGNAGVGKTALVEGLALKISEGAVPDMLKGKKIVTLDLNALQSTREYGELETNVREIMREVKESNGNILIFIDEIHRIVGDGVSDMGNLLKPYLARNFGVIGCTTLDEFRFIEKDPALDRRFQKLVINEPSVSDTVSILRGVKTTYEIFHGLTVKDSAIVSAVSLTARYITDKFLPDKALTILDEACSALRVTLDDKPAEIYELEQKQTRLMMESQALITEEDSKSIARLSEIETELIETESELEALNIQWESEKQFYAKIAKYKEAKEQVTKLLEKASNDRVMNDDVRVQMLDLKNINEELVRLEGQREQLIEEGVLLEDSITEASIAEAISSKTGIPVNKMLAEDRERVLNLPLELEKDVLGQKDAIDTIFKGVLRSKSGIQNDTRPNSYMFLGSTGVGKTQLAKAISNQLYDSEDKIIRVDMSEYMEKHSVSKLIGSPAGYVGYEDGGYLTEAVFRNPYSLVLFDEIEKAHPDVLTLLLQVLDDGRLTDSKGRTVNFKNCMIVMTTNLGSNNFIETTKKFGYITDEVKLLVRDLLDKQFRPEFVNRIDNLIFFNTLTLEVVTKIVDKLLKELNTRLEDRDIVVHLTEELKSLLAKEGYDPLYGARPLQRYFQDTVETEIALGIVSGDFENNVQLNLSGKPLDLQIEKE